MAPVKSVNCIVLYGHRCYKEVPFARGKYLYRCDRCQFTCKEKNRFDRHYMGQHQLRNKETLFQCKRCEAPPVKSRLSMKLHYSLHVGKWNAHMRRSVRSSGKMVGPVKHSHVISDKEVESELKHIISEDECDKRHGLIEHMRESRVCAIDVAKPSTHTPSRHVHSTVMHRRSLEHIVIEPIIQYQHQSRHSAIVNIVMN